MSGEGVAVWRSAYKGYTPNYSAIRYTHPDFDLEPGRWFPEAHAAALMDVARLADLFVCSPGNEPYRESLIEALDLLDAAKAGGEDA